MAARRPTAARRGASPPARRTPEATEPVTAAPLVAAPAGLVAQSFGGLPDWPWWGWALLIGGVLILIEEIWSRRAVVRFAMPLFEREPPFHLTPEPPEPGAEEFRVAVPGVTNDRGEPLTLDAAVIPARGPFAGRPRGAVVFCPETGGSKWFWRRYAAALPAAGFAVVAFEHRSHGASDVEPGYAPGHWPAEREVADALAVLRWALNAPRFAGLPVGLFGVSRGACVALAAAAREPRAAAVASDGGFVTDRLVTEFAFKWTTLAVPKWVIPLVPRWHVRQSMWLLRKAAERKQNRKFLALQHDLKRLRNRPVWLVGGARDGYVTPAQTERVAEMARAKTWIVPKAKHNQAREIVTEEYDRRLCAFFEAAMPPPEAGDAAKNTGPQPKPARPTLAAV